MDALPDWTGYRNVTGNSNRKREFQWSRVLGFLLTTRGRERERERERERARQRQRDRQTDRQTERTRTDNGQIYSN